MGPEVVQAATIVIMALVTGAIILMADTARSKTCPECPHCKRKIEDAERAKAKAAHLQYHGWTTKVEGCEFCEMDNK